MNKLISTSTLLILFSFFTSLHADTLKESEKSTEAQTEVSIEEDNVKESPVSEEEEDEDEEPDCD